MSRDRTGVGTRRGVRSGRSVCPDSVAEWSKAIDLKSIILWMRRFKSCHCRFCKIFYREGHRVKRHKWVHMGYNERQRGRVVKAVAC